ncbi:MAG: HEAT repeat domain-containing protein [Gemmatimonadetes bacterium]|nr:HEAT repeat domain-containing protein [Gemmatimonadota bacterium]
MQTITDHLFDDETMRRFLVDGYVVVKADLPDGVHAGIHRGVEEMIAAHGNLGNNILPLIPEIGQVFDHPAVRGAMTSILGRGYVMHPHRYCHRNPPGSEGQGFHKDTYEPDVEATHPRCRWAMAFYYPQDTSADMGPSAILPGSQYYETSEAAHEQPELPLCGEAGTVAIIHYDLWHRASPNRSNRQRYMLKFLFERTTEPSRPSWRNAYPGWTAPAGNPGRHQGLYEQLWHWNRGAGAARKSGPVNGKTAEALAGDLLGGDERTRIDAAFELGALGGDALALLAAALEAGSRETGRHAAIGLSSLGGAAVPRLVEALEHDSSRVRADAAYALADLGPAVWQDLLHADTNARRSAVTALTAVLGDESDQVRSNAAEALGTIGDPPPESVDGLAGLLGDRDITVRDNAARALARMGPAAEGAVPALVRALRDENRYVRFHAGLALRRIGSPAAERALFEDLLTARWCPLTTAESPY